jgi:ribosomal protein S18 acetylase RimI-like enzyme
MVTYVYSAAELTESQLKGFFVGWPSPPSPTMHLKLLNQSDYIVVALDDETGNVVGFITAISDNVLSAYVPLLEVLPSYQNKGIGGELVNRLLTRLGHLYMVDLLCDLELQTFYEQQGMIKAHGMMKRNYRFQSGPQNEGSA